MKNKFISRKLCLLMIGSMLLQNTTAMASNYEVPVTNQEGTALQENKEPNVNGGFTDGNQGLVDPQPEKPQPELPQPQPEQPQPQPELPQPQPEVTDGWQSIGGKSYYYVAGKQVFGEKKINKKWYFFDLATGEMRTGFVTHPKKTVYYAPTGEMLYGTHNINGVTYKFHKTTGKVTSGWSNSSFGKVYILNDGNLVKGEKKIKKKWYCFDQQTGAMITGWHNLPTKRVYYSANGTMYHGEKKIDGRWYYLDKVTGGMRTGFVNLKKKTVYYGLDGAMAYGPQNVNGQEYFFNRVTGALVKNAMAEGSYYGHDGVKGEAVDGWRYEGGYKFYYVNGVKQLDLDGILPKQSSYYIKVNRKQCTVTVYAKDGSNGYIIPVKRFACSVGLPSTPTPKGTFYTPAKYRWKTLMGPSYGQYCTRIKGGVLFHSVAGRNKTSYNLSAREYNKLGRPASHGCIRLTVRDAKWIYDNCKLKTKVTIYDGSNPGPLGKPETIKIPAGQTWDPTDPNLF